MTNPTRTAIINRALEVFELYNSLLPRDTINPRLITIDFTLRSRTAGSACWEKRRLNFNLILAADNLDEFLAQTVPHEIAHLYQTKIYPDSKPHGNEWKRVMRLGGFNPIRTHSYKTETPKRSVRTYPYTCACKNLIHHLGARRHASAVNGTRFYRCRICHTRLVPTHK